MIRRIHHVGVVVRRLREAYGFYRDTLRLPLLKEAAIADQGVRAALLAAGETEIELLEPLTGGTGVSRFLDRRGEGLHHVCFEATDIHGALEDLRERGVPLIDQAPRVGLAGQIAFLHPSGCAGVLVELAKPGLPEQEAESPLRIKRLVIGAAEPRQTAGVFQSLFRLPERAMNDGPRVMLGVGRGALLMVPAEEVGGGIGIVALSLVAIDFPALVASLQDGGTKLLKGTGEVTVDPASSHGVHLHISRYE
jgi:methylmalonyl-CoA/ethylmalonyl-CoA epimerase